MSEWRQEGEALVRDLKFKDFAEAMANVNRVADLAEEVNHHPDILVHGWNNVRLTLTTHAAGRLTDNDRETPVASTTCETGTMCRVA
jgi:4a-hydroxytetrahydrobiopterin dehydratase